MLLLVACGRGVQAPLAPMVPAKWIVEGASAAEVSDMRLEDFRVEALVAFRGDQLIALKPDRTPFPELQAALEEFYQRESAPARPEKPGYRMTYVVARSSRPTQISEPGKRSASISFSSIQVGLSFESVLPTVGLQNCVVLPVYVSPGQDQGDLPANVFASLAAPPVLAKVGSTAKLSGNSFKVVAIRKYKDSDGTPMRMIPGLPTTLRTTVMVSCPNELKNETNLLPMGKITYREGLWLYVDAAGTLQSKPMKDVNWQNGGRDIPMPELLLTKSDPVNHTLTYCTNLAQSELKGIVFMDFKRYSAKLAGVWLIP